MSLMPSPTPGHMLRMPSMRTGDPMTPQVGGRGKGGGENRGDAKVVGRAGKGGAWVREEVGKGLTGKEGEEMGQRRDKERVWCGLNCGS